MSFTKGDVVRIGKGKVQYTVTEYDGRTVFVQSHNTDKITEVPAERLVLIQDVMLAAEEAGCDPEELVIPAPVRTPAQRLGVNLAVSADQPVIEHTSYQKAILAGLQLKPNVFAGVQTTLRARKAKRAARRVAKASRKANR